MLTMLSCGISSIMAEPPETSFQVMIPDLPSHCPARPFSVVKPEAPSEAHHPGTAQAKTNATASVIEIRVFNFLSSWRPRPHEIDWFLIMCTHTVNHSCLSSEKQKQNQKS